MLLKNISIIAFLGLTILVSSCKKDVEGCTNPKASNYNADANKDNGSCNPVYDIPTTYTFKNSDGKSTVDFGGQKQRLEMLSELIKLCKTANTAGTAVSASVLKNMYANSGYTWADSKSLGLNSTSKQLKDKTAAGDVGIQQLFEAYMDSIGKISATTVANKEEGAPGKSGVWALNGKGPYLQSGKGIEYTQLIEKGLMCAVFMNQMTVNYLGGFSDDDNSKAVDAGNGKHYTEMEHHWDEAFGYFTSETDFPVNGTDRFWGEYSNKFESTLKTASQLSLAFRTGRAAISNNDYKTRDTQIKVIRDLMEKVCAAAAIHYLNDAKANISKGTHLNHSLSEATAFLGGLKYGYNAVNSIGMTAAQINTALGHIGDDFTKVTPQSLQNAIDEIAKNTGLESFKSTL